MDKKILWNLNDIFKVDDFDKKIDEATKKILRIEDWKLKLKPKMELNQFREFILWKEGLEELISRILSLPYLQTATDQKNQTARKLQSKAEELFLDYSNKIRPLNHWLKGMKIDGMERLDDENATRLFAAIPELHFLLDYGRKAAKHTLAHDSEEIILNKNINGISKLIELKRLVASDFSYKISIGGKVEKVRTQEELMKYVYSNSEELRESAYKSLLGKYKENIDKFHLVYQSVAKDWGFERKIRGYKRPISVQNFENFLRDEVVDTLLEVCRSNRTIFQSYFKLKAKELKKKRLRRYDIYAPVSQISHDFSFNEAKKIVLETLSSFNPNFGNKANQIIEEGHIDVYPSTVKRSGAFCSTVSPKITPYIMLNFTNKIRNVYTLAHELGHGIHSLYANQNLPSAQHANLPLAETASTLAEMVLFEKLYQSEDKNQNKKAMLFDKLADSYASILRQNYFVIFEEKAHEAISKGVTAEELSSIYLDTLEEQFGDSIEIDPLFRYEWAYISHIFESPFYCYAYNFGELVSYSLYAKYKKEGTSFIAKIEEVLKSGGSEDPDKVLKSVGIDMADPKFWQGSFDLIKDWQDELMNLSQL